MVNYILQILDVIKNMEEKIKKIMLTVLKISFGICILAAIVLYLYIVDSQSIITYEAGLILFKTGIALLTFGFICPFAFENLRKGMF